MVITFGKHKTLRSYKMPLDLKAFDKLKWMTSNESLERIGERLDKIRKVRLLTQRMIANLSLVDERLYQGACSGQIEKVYIKHGSSVTRKPKEF